MGSTVCRAIVGHTSVCSLAYKLSGLIHSQPWPVLHTAGDKQTGGEGVLCGPSLRHVLSSPSLTLAPILPFLEQLPLFSRFYTNKTFCRDVGQGAPPPAGHTVLPAVSWVPAETMVQCKHVASFLPIKCGLTLWPCWPARVLALTTTQEVTEQLLLDLCRAFSHCLRNA